MSKQQLSIGDISSVGYEDHFVLKTFKKIKGLSPRGIEKHTYYKNKVQHSSQYGCECIL